MRIATCCYCGTTASLPKKPTPGRIGCASCGAPLRRIGTPAPDAPDAPAPVRPPPRPRGAPAPLRQKSRRRPALAARVWDDLEDAVDDIIDALFD